MPNFNTLCPVCNGKVVVTEFACPNCETTIRGRFQVETDPFAKLTQEQRLFLLTFVQTEGRLNRMEEILGMSYPTLKNRLNELIGALGYLPESGPEKPAAISQRAQILDDLSEGRISNEDAIAFLKGEKNYEERE